MTIIMLYSIKIDFFLKNICFFQNFVVPLQRFWEKSQISPSITLKK